MSALVKVSRAFALLTEAEELLKDASAGLANARNYDDPSERDVQRAYEKVWEARREAHSLFDRGDA